MVAFDDLEALVPPPTAPIAADGDWTMVEQTLGVRLPTDFQALVRRYGHGQFADITLLTPFSAGAEDLFNLVYRARAQLDLYRDHRDAWPEDFPYSLYPEPQGLLEWANTGNGDGLYWLTLGEPDSWPVVIWNIREGSRRYEIGAVELLFAYLSGQREVDLLGPPPSNPWFDPFRKRVQVSFALAGGAQAYADRLRMLRDVLASTADRGSWDGGHGLRQDHFKAVDRDWLVTYENAYGHHIRVAFPPEDDAEVRRVVIRAALAMGCTVLDTSGPVPG